MRLKVPCRVDTIVTLVGPPCHTGLCFQDQQFNQSSSHHHNGGLFGHARTPWGHEGDSSFRNTESAALIPTNELLAKWGRVDPTPLDALEQQVKMGVQS